MADSKECCFITGVAGGVGMALAQAFDSAGYYVVGTDKTEPTNTRAIHRFVPGDLLRVVEDETYANSFFLAVEAALGQRALRALVNNAAVQVLGDLEQLSIRDWNVSLAVNVTAPMIFSKRLLPRLRAARGTIINISSIHASLTKKSFLAYATSKSALSGLTRALAVDIGTTVRVNGIAPAALDTPMLREGFAGRESLLRKLADYHPTGAIGLPREVGELAVLLAGSSIPFLNGAIIGLDGGIANCLSDPA